MLNKRFKDKKP